MISSRLNKKSRFKPYDPLDIMLGLKKWSDLPLMAGKSHDDDSDDDVSSGEACSDMDDDFDSLGKDAQKLKGRLPYTRTEQKAILDFIVQRRLYSELKGNESWKVFYKHCELYIFFILW